MIEKAKSKKILLIALESINNVGDEMLRATTEHILRSSIPNNIEVEAAQLKPAFSYIKKNYKLSWLVSAVILKLMISLRLRHCFRIKNLVYIIAYKKYFEDRIKNADYIILPVGMLKYSTQDFSYVFHLINKLATKYGKSVLMSAMSPQKADDKDWRYRQLVEAVNMPSVKMITTRDGQKGVDIIRKDYIRRDITCDYVGDPALWIPDCYGVEQKKKREVMERPHVGINIIREGIFDDYNKSFSDERLFQLYVQLIELINAKGWRWSVYTNGMESDWKVLRKLQQHIGFSDGHVTQQYTSAKDYVTKISDFDAVFGARLHACITPVSLGIPVVGFIWDDKLKHFSETMGIGQFFFQPQEMTAEIILAKLEDALKFDFDYEKRDKYKQKTVESFDKFLITSKDA